jgi:putative transposase
MIRAYQFLLRPTVGQAAALAAMLADHCSLYNGALHERRDAWRHVSKTSVTYRQQSAQLKEIRAFDPERQGRWSFSSQQATLRRLDKAFAAFFRRVTSGDTPGYPRFRGVSWFDTVDFGEGRGRLPVGLHPARPGHPRAPPGRRSRQGQPAPARGRQGQDRVGEA